jgi:Family of unknown function (DUF6065)
MSSPAGIPACVRLDPGAVPHEADEPIAFLMPVERGVVEGFNARIAPIEDDRKLKAAFQTWSASRDAFHAEMALNPPAAPVDKWQKLYYRGVGSDDKAAIDNHQTKLRVCPFSAASPKEN